MEVRVMIVSSSKNPASFTHTLFPSQRSVIQEEKSAPDRCTVYETCKLIYFSFNTLNTCSSLSCETNKALRCRSPAPVASVSQCNGPLGADVHFGFCS